MLGVMRKLTCFDGRVDLGRPPRSRWAGRPLSYRECGEIQRQELGLPIDASADEVSTAMAELLRYATRRSVYLCPRCTMHQEMPDLVHVIERIKGPMPTLFPEGCLPAITRSGLTIEPGWLPIRALYIFELSDSYIRRLARTGRVDSIEHPTGQYLIRVQSLRDYCDRNRR